MTESIRLAYLVCATPRSGSTLLCEMLRQTGVAGHPLEHFEILRHSGLPRQPREYFEDYPDPAALAALPPLRHIEVVREPCERWWARIVEQGRTANGIWGGKLMWGHIEDFLDRARELPGLSGADLHRVLRSLLRDPRFIFVTRGDKVAQAISLWRAVQTEAWRAGGEGESSGLTYDFGAIDHLRQQLESQEHAWTQWFAEARLQPIELSYEQLDEQAPGAVGEVLRELGLEGVPPPSPPLKRQRDELSAEWSQRYLREAGAAA